MVRSAKGASRTMKPPCGHPSRRLLCKLLRMRSEILHQQINQMRNQRNVRWRHRVVAQFVGTDPGQLLAFARDRKTLPAPADVERHQQMERVIGVAGKG